MVHFIIHAACLLYKFHPRYNPHHLVTFTHLPQCPFVRDDRQLLPPNVFGLVGFRNLNFVEGFYSC